MSVDTLEGVKSEKAAVAEADADPLFRVVAIGGRRRGVRLERIFWRLLDDLALRRGVKRSGLIGDVLGGMQGDNVASTLRCFAANEIDTERRVLGSQMSQAAMIGLMQQAPVPAFAINRQKKLQQVNAEFMQLLRPALAGGVTAKAADYVHLSLDTPIEELFAGALSGRATQCNYSLQVDDRRRRGRAKIVIVPGITLETLVGYVLT